MITSRDFLKLAALSTGVLAFRPFDKFTLLTLPEGERLGRMAVGKTNVFATPDGRDQPIGALSGFQLRAYSQARKLLNRAIPVPGPATTSTCALGLTADLASTRRTSYSSEHLFSLNLLDPDVSAHTLRG